MNVRSVFSHLVVVTLLSSVCFAQDDTPSKITPEAIDARIAEHRMGEIIVKTKPGAKVKVEQVRHEFLFGVAIPNSLAENDVNPMSAEDRKMYLKILEENFNYAVHENAMKWHYTEREQNVVDYSVADRIWELCTERNITMRGHCIFWAKDEYIMPWLNELNNDELRSAVKRRAIDVARHFKGRIEEFDLNNEMTHGDFYRRRLGYGIINEMALHAKMGNPDAQLYLNDYGILDLGFNAGTFVRQIRNLLANGVPIDGIGCQAHLALLYEAVTPPEHVQKWIDILSEFNLPIKITENLFVFHDEKVQEEQFRKLFPIYFAHPSVTAIVTWGFWAKSHWLPHSAMYREDWSPRPQALAYRELVFDKWWTKVSGKSDTDGVYKTGAFYGDYEITSNGETKGIRLRVRAKINSHFWRSDLG